MDSPPPLGYSLDHEMCCGQYFLAHATWINRFCSQLVLLASKGDLSIFGVRFFLWQKARVYNLKIMDRDQWWKQGKYPLVKDSWELTKTLCPEQPVNQYRHYVQRYQSHWGPTGLQISPVRLPAAPLTAQTSLNLSAGVLVLEPAGTSRVQPSHKIHHSLLKTDHIHPLTKDWALPKRLAVGLIRIITSLSVIGSPTQLSTGQGNVVSADCMGMAIIMAFYCIVALHQSRQKTRGSQI